MFGLKRFAVWRWLVAGLLCVLGAVMTACGNPGNPGVKPPEEGQARVFPLIAAPGDPVWLLDAPRDASPQGKVRVGGQTAEYITDAVSGWLRFEVPRKAGGGPQPIEFVGLSSPGLNLSLTVLPPESALQDTVLYAAASDLADIQKTYRDRLNRLLADCKGSCPSELTNTIERLSALKLPEFQPLLSGRTPGKQALASTSRPELNISKFPSPAPQPQPSQFCGQVAGVLPSSGLRTGQVISLLNLLFGGSLGTDPSTSGHPTQAPYQDGPPSAIIKKFLDAPTGNGKGVVIHVLDTASNSGDPFVMQSDVNYYNTIYKNRPYHGSIAGQVAQVVSPGATLDYQQICDKNGDCSTLNTIKALCAVAEEARKGGKHVVNLSAGGAYPTLGLLWALREVAAAGVPTAASYGNSDDCAGLVPGDRCNHFPADWSGSFATSADPKAPTLLLSVAGWDVATLQMATYNRGMLSPGVITPPPSVQAPGEFWFGGLPYFGSSFAAPVVSGVLANWMACKPGMPFLPFVNTPGQLPLPLSVVRACP
ncbi:S8/S53 family peptidase [Deinococcus sp. AJ005]|uniref:S8/S53 family peptidase n=1 Tax=Deinococcus sp. AJ005 TaxID=2652443 RepID=UPI00125CBC1A|nr:S8/S53 family peptidase [Deinococcus sp. AJ005]QFP75880.1 S8/S53 family peptidase [Deinococcus sp. AJ005]